MNQLTSCLSVCLTLLLLLTVADAKAQRPTAAVLRDLTDRAMLDISSLQEYLTMIGGAEEPLAVRRVVVRSARKIFSAEATVEEQSKSGRSRTYPVDGYLNTLLYRGNKNPIIMDFMMMTALEPEGLREVRLPDGSVAYRGKVRFEQHYCRTNGRVKRIETRTEPECSYEDRTVKEVEIDIRRNTSIKGVFWLIQIASIKVISVR